MGKIRTLLVKRAGRKLLEKYPKSFVEDFAKNKDALRSLAVTPKLRNRIAGQITCELKKARKLDAREKLKTESMELAASEADSGEAALEETADA